MALARLGYPQARALQMAARLSCTASKQGQPGQRTRSTNGGHARFPRQIAVCVSTHPLFCDDGGDAANYLSWRELCLPRASGARAHFSASQTVQIPSNDSVGFPQPIIVEALYAGGGDGAGSFLEQYGKVYYTGGQLRRDKYEPAFADSLFSGVIHLQLVLRGRVI